MRGLLGSFSDNELAELVTRCNSFSECLHEIGYVTVTGTLLRKLQNRIKEQGLDISHFTYRTKPPVKRSRENVFVKDADCTQKVLREWFLKENRPYKCSICGQEPFWNGKNMIMILDHINGDRHDNQLSNLRWVCPNCNSQLDTSTGKNIKHRIRVAQKYFCKECGAPISKGKELCKKCASTKTRKVNRPDLLELAGKVKEKGFVKIAEDFGVSGRTVQQWFEDAGIPYHKEDLVRWYNEQKGLPPTPEPETKKNITNIPRPVEQIDITTGELIATFESQAAAYRHLGKANSNHIVNVCNGLRKSAYGYLWKFKDT